MDSINFAHVQILKQQDMETVLWKIFKIIAPLTISAYNNKEDHMQMAEHIIPELSATFIEYEIDYDFSMIDILHAALQKKTNILNCKDFFLLMQTQGPDNNAKLALMGRILREGVQS